MRTTPIEGREASQRMSASIGEADNMGDSDSTGADDSDDQTRSASPWL
jgi:hypothetical protein